MTNEKTRVTTDREKRELTVERDFDAPRELVFRAYAEAEHLQRWWGPKGWTLPVCNVDFRPGGVWHYCMRGPGGEESWGKATYREIEPPARIVYTDAFSDKDGSAIPGMPEMLIAVEFSERDGRTTVRSRTQFASMADFDAVIGMGVVQGVTETLDRLEEHLASQI